MLDGEQLRRGVRDGDHLALQKQNRRLMDVYRIGVARAELRGARVKAASLQNVSCTGGLAAPAPCQSGARASRGAVGSARAHHRVVVAARACWQAIVHAPARQPPEPAPPRRRHAPPPRALRALGVGAGEAGSDAGLGPRLCAMLARAEPSE